MNDAIGLLERATKLQENRKVSVVDQAKISLAVRPLIEARIHLVNLSIKLKAASNGISALVAGDHDSLIGHEFTDEGYSKVTTLGIASRYKQAYWALHEAVRDAEIALLGGQYRSVA